MEALATYAIYASPKDFPGEFVCRRWRAIDGKAVPDAEPLARASTLEACRASLWHLVPCLTRLDRHPNDDPVIVEVWL